MHFPVYFPVSRIGGDCPIDTRAYHLHGHAAYVVVVDQGGLGQFYDLEGTAWTKPRSSTTPTRRFGSAGGR